MDPIITLNLPIATKLNQSNFLTWKSQILPLLHGYNLMRFVESPPPDATRHTTSGQLEVNPDFASWHRQDQLLLGWLRSSLTEMIQAQVVSCTTTGDLWSTLHRVFSSFSRARLSDLRRQIQTTSKGGASCAEFLQTMRRLSDELAFIGSPISDDDLVIATLNRLGPDFNSFVVAVTTSSRNDPFSFADLHGLLLTHEALLKNQASTSTMANPSAFNTGRNFNFKNRNPNPQSFRPNQATMPLLPNPSFQPNSNLRPPTPHSQSYNRPQANSLTRPQCQICNRIGHLARICYSKYDQDEAWSPRPARQAYNAQSSSQPSSSSNTEWVLDSGATNQVTNDLNNLSSFFNYGGHDTLQIGNGAGLQIHNIGSTSLHISSHFITLNDILHVPQFSKNLISISKLLLDNPHLSIDFFNSTCAFKVHPTKTTILQVPSLHGLFSLHLSSASPQAFFGVKAPASVWHARFCHPSNATTLHILKSFNLPCVDP